MVSSNKAEAGNHGKLQCNSSSSARTRTEKERRKRMQNMFSNLHSLLPNFPDHRVDKPTIVEEAVKYIKTLQATIGTLQQEALNKRRPSQQGLDISLAITEPEFRAAPLSAVAVPPPLSLPASNGFRTFVSNNVVECVAGEDAHINLCCLANLKPAGLLVGVAFVLDKFKLEFISGRISAIGHVTTFMIHARASGCTEDSMKVAEDVFKMAAGEIAILLASS